MLIFKGGYMKQGFIIILLCVLVSVSGSVRAGVDEMGIGLEPYQPAPQILGSGQTDMLGLHSGTVDQFNRTRSGSRAATLVASFPSPVTGNNGLTFDGHYLWIANYGDRRAYQVDPENGSSIRSIPLPGGNYPDGLGWDGRYLWHSDSNTDLIYQIDPYDGTVMTSFLSPGTGPKGLAYDGTNLWNTDTDALNLYELTMAGSVVSTTPVLGTYPTGLAFDGRYLWHSDNHTDTIYRIDPNDMSVVESFPSPGSFPNDLAWDGEYLWVVDNGTDMLYKYDVGMPKTEGYVAATWSDDSIHILDRFMNDIDSFSAGALTPNGIATDGEYIYSGHFDTQEVVVYDFDGMEHYRWSADLSGLQGMTLVNGALAIAKGLVIQYYGRFTGDFMREIPRLGTNIEGIAYDGSLLWLLDNTDILGVSTVDGSLVTTVPNPASGCSFGGTGLTFSAPHELTAACSNGAWFKVNTVTGTVSSSGNNSLDMYGLSKYNRIAQMDGACELSITGLTGLTYDGNHLWVADYDTLRAYEIDPVTCAEIRSIPLPGAVPFGLAWDGTYLWCADPMSQLLHQIDSSDGTVLASVPSSYTFPTGMAYDGSGLWNADSATTNFTGEPDLIADLSNSGLLQNTFDALGAFPSGLAFDGVFLWHSDNVTDTVYRMYPDNLTVKEHFPAPGSYPNGLAFDGEYLWVAENNSDTLYRYRVSDPIADWTCDDFDRASSSNIGGWTEQLGDWVMGFGGLFSPGIPEWCCMTRNGSEQADGCTSVKVYYGSGASLRFGGLTARWRGLRDDIMIKVQDNNSVGYFDTLYIYDGLSSLFMVTGLNFGTTPDLEMDYVGTALTARIDVDNDGIWDHEYSETVTRTGIGLTGVIAYDTIVMDDWCYGAECYEISPIPSMGAVGLGLLILVFSGYLGILSRRRKL